MNRGIGKAAWIVIFTIVAIVVLSVFAMSYWEQLKAHDGLHAQIVSTEQLAGKISFAELLALESTLNNEIGNVQTSTRQVQSSLEQPLDCLATTNAIYALAQKDRVEIEAISSSGKNTQQFEGVKFDCLMLSIKAKGSVDSLMEFMRELGAGFSTAIPSSVTIEIPESGTDEKPVMSMVMSINSYEGK